MSGQNTKTPAMVLQEFTVKYGYSPPEYVLVHSKTGTHENEFHYQVNVANISGTGFGRSKQVAKHSAASKALELLANHQLYDPQSDPVQHFDAQSHRNETGSPFKSPINFKGTLADLCCDYKLPHPVFIEISDVGPPHCRLFTYQCKLASITTQAIANTKKQAKQLAAKEMMERIKENFPELVQEFANEANRLTENNETVIEKYNALNLDVVVNRSVTMEESVFTIRKIMDAKGFAFENFSDEIDKACENSLKTICELLEIDYKIVFIQDEEPIIACFQLGIETPFVVIASGKTQEQAVENLICNVCDTLKNYMNMDLSLPTTL